MAVMHPFRGAPSSERRGSRMRGARAIVESLKAHQTEYLFGVPGSTAPLFAEFAGREDIRLVLTHDERAAACMADGYARISYKPGVCSGCTGPGTTNLLTGIGEAWMSSVPVIAITDARSPSEMDKNPIMFCRGRVFDTFEVLRPFTKWSVQVHDASRVPELVHRAYAIATSGRPGPVQVEMLPDALYGEWDYDIPQNTEYAVWPSHRTWPDPEKLKAAARLLLEADRPVIIAGGGVLHAQAWNELLSLAEYLTIPVATTLYGKGAIAETHPLAVGVTGIHSRVSALETVREADLVLFVGSNTDMHTTDMWRVPAPGKVRVIHIDVDADEFSRNYPTEVAILSDARTALAGLLSAVQELRHEPVIRRDRLDVVAGRLLSWRAAIAADQRSDSVPIKPQRLMWEIGRFLKDDAIVLGDLSFSSVWVDVHYDVRRAGRRVSYARGFDILGWGLPASLGAQLAAPGRQVLSLIGDGSLGYCIGELETARRYNIPAVNVVLNNSTLGYEKFIIRYHNEPGKITRDIAGCDYSDTDYAAVARAMGCVGIRVERPDQIAPALQQAFSAGRPALIDVVIDAEVIPPITFFPEQDRSL